MAPAFDSFPVLWRDSRTSCVRDTIEISPSDFVEHDFTTGTVKILSQILNTKLLAMTPPEEQMIPQVANVLLYGAGQDNFRRLDALIPELSASCPRLMFDTYLHDRNSNEFRVIVRCMKTGDNVYFKCYPSTQVKGVTNAFAWRVGAPRGSLRFLYHDSPLRDDMLVQEVVGSDGIIQCHPEMVGGGPIHFANVSDDDNLSKQKLSEEAPNWRVCDVGLNVEGICKFRKCPAFGEMIVRQYKFDSFNLMKDGKIKCPTCRSDVTPLTCGFYECFWKFEGVQTTTGMRMTSPWKPAFGNKYHRFDADESHGSVSWASLLIVAKPKETLVGAMAPVRRSRGRQKKATIMCGICWNRIKRTADQPASTTTCRHSFHKKCMDSWTLWCRDHDSLGCCPLCHLP